MRATSTTNTTLIHRLNMRLRRIFVITLITITLLQTLVIATSNSLLTSHLASLRTHHSHTQDPPSSASPPPIQPIASVSSPVDNSQLASQSPGGDDLSEVGLCEVCMYVMENKMQHQPYLCRGLKDAHYQSTCVQVMESLMWWITNEVYWVNYGCQMNQNGAVSWVRPCPASAMCSWLQHLYLRRPFCGPQSNFPKPT